MRKLFLFSWFVFFVIYFFTPARPVVSDDYFLVWLIEGYFIGVIAFFLPQSVFRSENIRLNKPKVVFFISLFGMMIFISDRIFQQGFSFDSNLAEIRYHHYDKSGSTSYSFLGLIAYFTMPSAFLLVFHGFGLLKGLRVSRYTRLSVLSNFVPSVMVTVLVSFFTGGRTSILILFAVYLLAFTYSGLKFNSISISKFYPALLFSLVIAAVYYSAQIFKIRAEYNDIPIDTYVEALISRLGGYVTYNNSEYKTDFIALYTASMSYVAHIQWIGNQIVDLSVMDGQVFFNAWKGLLNKLPYVELPVEPWTFVGLFTNIPLAIYYDYQWFGVLIIPVLLGLIYRHFHVRFFSRSSWSFIVIYLLGVVILVSPFAVVTELMLFPLLTINVLLLYVCGIRIKIN